MSWIISKSIEEVLRMITLSDEQVERMCDKYCRYPRKIALKHIEDICDKCPLVEAGRNEKDK